MTLGEIIKGYRELHGISQRQFGKMSGLSNSYIHQLEYNENAKNGLPIKPSLTTVKQVADAMDMDLDTLLRQLGDLEIDISEMANDFDDTTGRIMRIVIQMSEAQKKSLLQFLRATFDIEEV